MDLTTFFVTIRNLALPVGVLAAAVGVIRFLPRKFGGVILILLAIIEYGYFFNKYQPFSPAKFVFPPHPVFEYLRKNAGVDRYFGFDFAYIDNNFATYYRVFAPEGYDPLDILRYSQFLRSSDTGDVPSYVSRSDAYVGKDDNPLRDRLFDVLGVKYIVGIDAVLSKDNYELVWHEGRWNIYERKNVLPRAFLAGSYVVETNGNEIIKTFYADGVNPKNTLVLEKTPAVLPENGGQEAARIMSYETNAVTIQTIADKPKLLFLSDNYYPGWVARIDGKETPILRANYTFRAVAVPAGVHQVRFSYEPVSLKAGAVVTLLGLLFWLGTGKRWRPS